MRIKGLAVILSAVLTPFLGIAQDPTEIIRKTDEKARGETSKGQMTITIVRPTWQREMTVKNWTRGSDYSFILITAPNRDKGTVFLKRNREIWNWIPSIDRNIKLPPSMMMQSWMGSDFTNDDLIKESSIVEDYTHELMGDTLIGDREAWKIKLVPKPDAPVVWGKIISWIDKDEFIELRSEMYDEDGYLVNEIIFSEIKPLGGKILPSKLEYIPVHEEGHKTVIKYHDIVYDEPIAESFFSLQNMKRIR